MLLIEQIVNGLMIAAVYALTAVGLSLIFGILRFVNFAHGEMYMLGGFVYYFCTKSLGLTPVFGVLTAGVTLFMFGVVVQRGLIGPVHKGRISRPEEYVILITFGLSVFLQNLALALFKPWNRQPMSFWTGRLSVGELVIGGDRLVAFILGGCTIAALVFVMHHTYFGKGLRAISQNRDAAISSGIRVERMDVAAFGIGAALAGTAGALIGPIFLVHPTMGILPSIKAFVIVVLGGMGSVPGSIVGAVILALTESIGSVYLPDPIRAMAYKDAYGLVILVAVLLLRPQGLFGERVRRA